MTGRYYAIVLLLTSVGAGALGFYVLRKLREVAIDQDIELSPLVQMIIDQPLLVALLAVPALLFGMLAVAGVGPRFLMLLVGYAFALAALAATAIAFFAVIVPMYQYQAL